MDDERLVLLDDHLLGEVVGRLGEVDRRDAVVVEDAERGPEAQVDARGLDHAVIPRIDADAALLDEAADRPVGEHGRGGHGASLAGRGDAGGAGRAGGGYAWSARRARATTVR